MPRPAIVNKAGDTGAGCVQIRRHALNGKKLHRQYFLRRTALRLLALS